jgi:glyceraldehyde-3-phosphate dehydrogenase (NADP+)
MLMMNTKEDAVEARFVAEHDIPEGKRPPKAEPQSVYLVNGELKSWNGDYYDIFSPILIREGESLSPRRLGAAPVMTAKESAEALDAAVEAYDRGMGPWPSAPVSKRIKAVEAFIRQAEQRKEIIVNLLMWETAKSYVESVNEFERTIRYMEDTVEHMRRMDDDSRAFHFDGGFWGQISYRPIGVVLCMGPSNYPLYETYSLLIPALLTGNTVILKFPRIGVLLHGPLLAALRDCFPAGVVNVVYGDGEAVTGPLMESGKVDVLAFMGPSQYADRLILKHPAPHRLHLVLGLEAKNPAIVLADADLDLTVPECLLGALAYNGQRCAALKLLYVHESIAESFVSLLEEAVFDIGVGMPWEANIRITPLADPQRLPYLRGLVEDSEVNDASVVNAGGGQIVGTIFYPAILYPVNSATRVYREEQFGPIIPVVPFNDISEPIRYLQESRFGQQASIFGGDPRQVSRVANGIVNHVSRVNINAKCQRGPDLFPFSGKKDSGQGVFSIHDALESFALKTVVAAKENEGNSAIKDYLEKTTV